MQRLADTTGRPLIGQGQIMRVHAVRHRLVGLAPIELPCYNQSQIGTLPTRFRIIYHEANEPQRTANSGLVAWTPIAPAVNYRHRSPVCNATPLKPE